MSVSQTAADDRLLAAVHQVLEGLKKTADGAVLYSFIERGLRKFGASRIETAFLAFVDKLLVRYLDGPDSDPATRIKVKVIQQRLRPYLAEIPVRPAPPVPQPATAPGTEKSTPPGRVPDVRTVTPDNTPVEAIRQSSATVERSASQSPPEQLAHHVTDALTRGRDFDTLLRTSLQILEQSDAAPDAELKDLLRTGIEELIAEHRALEKDLTNTKRGLQVMADDRRQMEKALNQARQNSLTDELTGLPPK